MELAVAEEEDLVGVGGVVPARHAAPLHEQGDEGERDGRRQPQGEQAAPRAQPGLQRRQAHSAGAASRIAATKPAARSGAAGSEGTSVVARQRSWTKPSTCPSLAGLADTPGEGLLLEGQELEVEELVQGRLPLGIRVLPGSHGVHVAGTLVPLEELGLGRQDARQFVGPSAAVGEAAEQEQRAAAQRQRRQTPGDGLREARLERLVAGEGRQFFLVQQAGEEQSGGALRQRSRRGRRGVARA